MIERWKLMTYTGDVIRKLRKQKKYTQKQLGEICGIADSNIRKYETGTQKPKIETLQKIASALGVPVEMLQEDLAKKYISSSELLINDTNKVIEVAKSALLNNPAPGETVTEEEVRRIIKSDMLEQLDELNVSGFFKIQDYARDLAKIPEYRKDN